MPIGCRSQWPRGLRRRSAAARLLGLWVRIPPKAWIFVCCECCVLSDRGQRRVDHSYRGVLPTVVRRRVWFRNLVNEETMAQWGLSRQLQRNYGQVSHLTHVCSGSVSVPLSPFNYLKMLLLPTNIGICIK